MCCGSKRSGLSSASASRPPPRGDRAPFPRPAATPMPVTARPIPPTQPVDAKETAVFAPNPQFRRSATQPDAPAAPRPARIWRLSS